MSHSGTASAAAATDYAPGMRVEIRDAEWRIRRVDCSSDGGYVLACDGLFQQMQGRGRPFLTKLKSTHILDPHGTRLTDDNSATPLHINRQILNSAPSDKCIPLSHRPRIVSSQPVTPGGNTLSDMMECSRSGRSDGLTKCGSRNTIEYRPPSRISDARA